MESRRELGAMARAVDVFNECATHQGDAEGRIPTRESRKSSPSPRKAICGALRSPTRSVFSRTQRTCQPAPAHSTTPQGVRRSGAPYRDLAQEQAPRRPRSPRRPFFFLKTLAVAGALALNESTQARKSCPTTPRPRGDRPATPRCCAEGARPIGGAPLRHRRRDRPEPPQGNQIPRGDRPDRQSNHPCRSMPRSRRRAPAKHGKGFVVLAHEVGKLAESAGQMPGRSPISSSSTTKANEGKARHLTGAQLDDAAPRTQQTTQIDSSSAARFVVGRKQASITTRRHHFATALDRDVDCRRRREITATMLASVAACRGVALAVAPVRPHERRRRSRPTDIASEPTMTWSRPCLTR